MTRRAMTPEERASHQALIAGVTERHPAWMDEAACKDMKYFTEMQTYRQRAVCRPCPVKAECLERGMIWLVSGDSAVYGGLSGDQRVELRRRSRAAK